MTAVTRNNYHVREEFVGFYECEDGVTGQVMATLVMKKKEAGHHSAKTKNLSGTAQPCKHPC